MTRPTSLAFAAVILATPSCSASCPDGWELDDSAQVCQPPAEATAAAKKKLATGIYGYALACVSTSDEDCSCVIDGLAGANDTTLVGGRLDEIGQVAGTDIITVRSRADSTFEAELVPGVSYQYAPGALHGGRPGFPRRADGEAIETIRLEEGEVLFLQLVADGDC